MSQGCAVDSTGVCGSRAFYFYLLIGVPLAVWVVLFVVVVMVVAVMVIVIGGGCFVVVCGGVGVVLPHHKTSHFHLPINLLRMYVLVFICFFIQYCTYLQYLSIYLHVSLLPIYLFSIHLRIPLYPSTKIYYLPTLYIYAYLPIHLPIYLSTLPASLLHVLEQFISTTFLLTYLSTSPPSHRNMRTGANSYHQHKTLRRNR